MRPAFARTNREKGVRKSDGHKEEGGKEGNEEGQVLDKRTVWHRSLDLRGRERR